MEPTLTSYLAHHNIQYKEFTHPAVFTVEESREIKKTLPGMQSKNLFLKSKGKFYLYTLSTEDRLDIKALKKHLKVKDLQFASPQELKEELSLTPGSVSIFGMIHAKNTHLMIDKKIWEAEQAGFHPNINTATLILTHTELEKFCSTLTTSWEVVNLA